VSTGVRISRISRIYHLGHALRQLGVCVAFPFLAQHPLIVVHSFTTSAYAPCFITLPSLCIRRLSNTLCFLILLIPSIVLNPRPCNDQFIVDFYSEL
jgi:hypothetical protein